MMLVPASKLHIERPHHSVGRPHQQHRRPSRSPRIRHGCTATASLSRRRCRSPATQPTSRCSRSLGESREEDRLPGSMLRRRLRLSRGRWRGNCVRAPPALAGAHEGASWRRRRNLAIRKSGSSCWLQTGRRRRLRQHSGMPGAPAKALRARSGRHLSGSRAERARSRSHRRVGRRRG